MHFPFQSGMMLGRLDKINKQLQLHVFEKQTSFVFLDPDILCIPNNTLGIQLCAFKISKEHKYSIEYCTVEMYIIFFPI